MNKTLHQVWVTDRLGQAVRVGPQMDEKDALFQLVESINLAVAAGKEKDWFDARIESVDAIPN
jgi:hypothetical protein